MPDVSGFTQQIEGIHYHATMHCGNRVHLFSEMDAVLFILIRKEKVQRLTLFETLAPIRKKHPVTVSGL
ncbi:hypothetical protein SAMN04488025_1127 [Planifilum fulgidum]|uniref:Uncharacterized protein n=1 Tax=Planifilum fulgidum TaxID=201973 RepID=A0A1I2NAA0_9BACL|nr:hypothetical protein SAMN04488025_1127 [Planifilum fulgidum]